MKKINVCGQNTSWENLPIELKSSITIAAHACADKKTVKILFKNGADLNLRTNSGHTALQIAEENFNLELEPDNTEVIKFLKLKTQV